MGDNMKLTYSEIYGKDTKGNGYCLPTLELYYTYEERKLIPKSKYLIEEKEEDSNLYTAYIPFFSTFFDGLKEETISKLKSIFDFTKKYNRKDYISKEIWKPFLFTSNIAIGNIQKTYNTHLEKVEKPNSRRPLYKKYNRKSANQLEVEKYYKSRVSKYNQEIGTIQRSIYNELTNHFLNNVKPSLKQNYIIQKTRDKDLPILSIMKQGVYGGIMNIEFTFDFRNELELLYSFLECIFQSDYNYKIKRCNNKECLNFYITLDTKTKHCPYCLSTIKKLQKQKYENKDLVKIERRVYQLVNAPNRRNEKKEYLGTKRKKKKKLVNGIITEKEYIDWLLSYYRTKYN